MKYHLMPLLLLPILAYAQDRTDRFEVEAGVVSTRNMEIRGFNQGNATEDWSKSAPIARLEYWRVRNNDWNYGLVLQSLSIKYQDTIRHDLNVKGKVFKAGDVASLDYQFPTLRFSSNVPVFKGDDGGYIRAGGTVIARYAKVGLKAKDQSFTDTNLIVIPVVNLEASKPLSKDYSLFARTDFLPGIDGNVFLDGLYDIFFGVRKKIGGGNDFDLGVRLFFGGYDPKKVDDYANRIFFSSLVMRYSF